MSSSRQVRSGILVVGAGVLTVLLVAAAFSRPALHTGSSAAFSSSRIMATERSGPDVALPPASDSFTWIGNGLVVSDPFIVVAGSPAEQRSLLNCVIPTNGDMAGLFFRASNSADEPDHLVSADTDAADMTMAHAAGVAFVVPAHGQAIIEPGSNYVMLMDLTRPLHPGDSVWVSLHFKIAGDIRLRAIVRASGSLSHPDEVSHRSAYDAGPQGSPAD
jgi:copper(I)-binding protein